MIRLHNVTKTFNSGTSRIEALNDISLDIKKGVIFGVIGLSGAGKSTLIRCINMLEKPDCGEIEVAGQQMTRLSESELMVARRRIGMIFQHFNLLASRTVAGNVAFPLEIAGLDKHLIRSRVQELLELVGLGDRADAYPTQLSGGQKQRVGIARALANEPDVLLSDEATSALDPETTLQVLHLLRDISRRMGLTIVMITHEMGVIREICDQVAVIDGGRLVEVGDTASVFTRPQSLVTRRLLRGQMEAEIPAELLHRKTHPGCRLVKLSFLGEVAEKPVIAELVRDIAVTPNILYGRIDRLQDRPWGTLIVELAGEPEDVEGALLYLNNVGVDVEVLGNGKSNSNQSVSRGR
ncbi:MAG: methionine ABC transporter ATP-binding protein [Limnochordia bacterium]